jgi:hypothetical protein
LFCTYNHNGDGTATDVFTEFVSAIIRSFLTAENASYKLPYHTAMSGLVYLLAREKYNFTRMTKLVFPHNLPECC